MWPSRIFAGVVALVLAALLVPPDAMAQDDPAATLFREGRDAATRGDFVAACAKFTDSYALAAKAGTLLNLADCEEHTGKLALALLSYKHLADILSKGDDRGPLVQEKLAALEKRVPRLTINLARGTPFGTSVNLDAVKLDAASLGVPLPVDPGDHVLTSSARSYDGMRIAVTLKEGEIQEIKIGVMAKESGALADETKSTVGSTELGALEELVPSKSWLSFAFSFDAGFVNRGDICSADNYKAGTYNCFRQGQNQALYNPGSPDPAAPNFTSKYALRDRGASTGLPFAVGTIRFLLGYDRVVYKNLAIGGRFGWAIDGGPTVVDSASGDKKFLPLHAEVRATYWIGKNVLVRTGVRPYLYLGGGLAEVDAKVDSVSVSDDCDLPPNPPGGTACPPGQRQKITVDAWRRMAGGFVGLGGGIAYAVSAYSALTADLKASLFFSPAGIAISPSIGYIQGL